MPAEEPYVTISRLGTAYWFGFLFILAPLIGHFEKPKELPQVYINQWRVKHD